MDEGVVGLALTYAIVLTGMFQWCVRVSAEVENQVIELASIPKILLVGCHVIYHYPNTVPLLASVT